MSVNSLCINQAPAFLFILLFISIKIHLCHADCELESLRQLHDIDPDWVPNAIIDVGANVGCWTSRARKVFPKTKFMMFEAFVNFTASLDRVKAKQNGMVDFCIEVLSDKNNETVQFWAEGATGNSMFPQLLGRGGRGHSDIEPVFRTTKRLDTARDSSFLKDERVDILKLDVQGAELTVLRGAGDILKEVSFVQFEASVVEYNKGGSCHYEVDAFLRENGFYLYNFGDIMRDGIFQAPGGVGQYDALYIRPTSENLPPRLAHLKTGLFCGSNRPQDKVSTTISPDADVKSTPCLPASTPQNQWLGHVGSILAGILIGKYLLPMLSTKKEIAKHN